MFVNFCVSGAYYFVSFFSIVSASCLERIIYKRILPILGPFNVFFCSTAGFVCIVC